MTREESLSIITEAIEDYVCNYVTDTAKAQKMLNAIQTLEQEPCEDAISRQAVLDLVADYDLSMGQVVRGIHALPSVKLQEPKTGYWIERRSRATGHIESICSECGAEEGYPYNDYCGNCGAKMVEPQESEDEE